MKLIFLKFNFSERYIFDLGKFKVIFLRINMFLSKNVYIIIFEKDDLIFF